MSRLGRWALRQAADPVLGGVMASELGHPCDRYLWRRIRGRAPRVENRPPVRIRRRFAFGRIVEQLAEQALLADGYRIVHRQETWTYEGLVYCRPEFVVERDGVREVVEVKSSTDARKDVLASPERMARAWWVYASWITQAQVYAAALNLPARLWIITFPSLHEREYVFAPDEARDRAADALARVRRLAGDVPEPPPIQDASVCGRCPFLYDCPGAALVNRRGLAAAASGDVAADLRTLVETEAAHRLHEAARSRVRRWIEAHFRDAPAFAAATPDGYVLRGRWVHARYPERRIPARDVVYPRWTYAKIESLEPKEASHEREGSDASAPAAGR